MNTDMMEKEMFERLDRQIKSYHPNTVKHRRFIHKHPETGFDTKNTEQYIKDFLVEESIEIIPTHTGVIGRISAKTENVGIIALRADMDALSLQEKEMSGYESVVSGKMHACGHDGHTSMLMTAAKLLKDNRELLNKDVLVIFQPAEEGPAPGGAMPMIEELREQNILSKIENIFALHLSTEYPTGTLGIGYGSVMASTDDFDIEIIGKGGHAGLPHKSIDALSLSANFVIQMERFMSRCRNPFDPAIFSIGVLNTGSGRNIIPETASLSGTLRCQSEYSRQFIMESAERILKSVCDCAGADYRMDIQKGLPVLINDEKTTRYAENVARQALGNDSVIVMGQSNMGAEDFAYFAKEIPSCFMWVGARNEAKGFVHLMHDPRFDFDEDALDIGVKMLCLTAICV